MVENKKVDPSKTEATTAQPAAKSTTAAATETSPTPRVAADIPGDKITTPSVGEVKKGSEIRPEVVVNKDANKPTPDKIIEDTVARTAESVKNYNESAPLAASPEIPEPKKKDTVPAPTKEEAIKTTVERTAESVDNFNKSAETEKKVEARRGTDAERDLKPDVKRVAPLTGELREDQEDDSYVTPGRVLTPPAPRAEEPPLEVEEQPMVIAPITGEVRPADEVSYPTPGRIVDEKGLAKSVEVKDIHRFGKKNSVFNVPVGRQVPLFEANKEMIRNKRANSEDYKLLAQAMAEAAMAGLDGLRRTRRTQKNLR